jgi:hypothetical protein
MVHMSVTDSMELSPSWQAASCAATQDIPNILWYLEVLYRVRLGLPSSLFPTVFSTNILYAFRFSPFMLHALTIPSSLTGSFWLYLTKITSYEAPHYAAFSNHLSLNPSSVQTFSSAPCFQTPSVYVPPLMSEIKFHTHTKPYANFYFFFLYILICTFYSAGKNTKVSELIGSKNYHN